MFKGVFVCLFQRERGRVCLLLQSERESVLVCVSTAVDIINFLEEM